MGLVRVSWIFVLTFISLILGGAAICQVWRKGATDRRNVNIGDMSKGKKRARGRGDDIEEDDSGEDELKENDGDDEDEEEGARKKVKPEKTEEIDIFA